jgi:hypothetical protein
VYIVRNKTNKALFNNKQNIFCSMEKK